MLTEKQLLTKIQASIKEGYEKISNNYDKAILLIGKTGAGKSTLINYLTNVNKLKAIIYKNPKVPDDEGILVLDVIENDKNNLPKIGHTPDAETFIPNKSLSSDGTTIYWDCPGFGDTAGPEKDIPNAYFIKRIFETANNVKLLLLINYNDLQNPRATDIKALTDTLSNLFEEKDFDIIKTGISLIISNVPDIYQRKPSKKRTSEDIIKTKIEKILNAKCFQKNSISKKILNLFIEQPSKIILFKQPKNEGTLTEGKNEKVLGLANNSEMHAIINKTEFINKPKVNIAISSESTNKVSSLVEEINCQIRKCVDEDLIKELRDYLNIKIQSLGLVHFSSDPN